MVGSCRAGIGGYISVMSGRGSADSTGFLVGGRNVEGRKDLALSRCGS